MRGWEWNRFRVTTVRLGGENGSRVILGKGGMDGEGAVQCDYG